LTKKKILIISLTHQGSDPRVIRQMNFLRDRYEIFCCGLSNDRISQDKFFPVDYNSDSLAVKINIGSLKLLKLHDLAEDYILRSKMTPVVKIDPGEFDLIIANDLDAVPMSYKVFRARKVLADFHEFTQSEFEDRFYFKYIHKGFVIHTCKKYFPKLDAVTTVCESIAEEFNKHYSVSPVVITNASEYRELSPSPVGEKIRMIHHGAAISSRKIELMIEAARLLDDRFTLDLMLVPNEPEYYSELKEMINADKRIRMTDPVQYNEIIDFCNPYDIGLFILPPVNLNYRYALPNKFFEFIQSRLAVITGPSIEMKRYIDKYKLGISTGSFDPKEIAEEINGLSNAEIEQFKMNSHLNSRELSSERNSGILNEIVSNLISD
jgi:hypothetical protein